MNLQTLIEEKLQTVHDPEFPLIDIWTMGLIYELKINEDDKELFVLMSFTTPACPSKEVIEQMVRNAIAEIAPEYFLTLEITYDPMRTYEMIKDEDLKKMFLV